MKPTLARSAFILLLAVALYFGVGAFLLRFELDRVLFPRTPAFAGAAADRIEHLSAATGAELLVRQYGNSELGCVVFFPGQHGYLPTYDLSAFTDAGVGVWLLSYPGQDGATGSADVGVVEDLAKRAVRMALAECPQDKVVILGVSLGATLGAQASVGSDPAGLVLVSAAPSLSDAIRTRLASRWYLSPLRLLPIEHLLKRNFILAELLPSPEDLAIFQGSDDEQTPLDVLAKKLGPSLSGSIVRVMGGTHSTTFALSSEAQLSTILRMLSLPESGHWLQRREG